MDPVDLSTLALFRSAVGALALVLMGLWVSGLVVVLALVEWGNWRERRIEQEQHDGL